MAESPDIPKFAWGRLVRAVHRLSEPQMLFPFTAILLLLIVWTMTFSIVRVTRSSAQHAAASATNELLDTYEAQVVRALREIDQTLNIVRYWHERAHGSRGLQELRELGLLPPDLLFVVSVADARGRIVDSTRSGTGESVADLDYFQEQRKADSFFTGKTAPGDAARTEMHFSRRLNTAGGAFEGIVIVSVQAAYFVSAYDTSKWGTQGLLALVGTDGAVRIRRTGESHFAGDTIDYAGLISRSNSAGTDAAIVTAWDGIRRWTRVRELYGYPFAVIAGLGTDEQLAPARRDAIIYEWRAALASALIVVLSVLLGRMSWQLARSRTRERDAISAHAERIGYLAFHDVLTGLPNRRLFSQVLSQSITHAHRHDTTLAVAFIDLDRFKQINDSLGHEAGDALLQEVAARLRTCVRAGDTLARLGGDEFVVLLPELAGGQDAAGVAQKILTDLAKPFTLMGQEFYISASIGISQFPHDGADEQTLTKHADVAMYQAKAEGKNNFQFYRETEDATLLERLTLESGLRHALAREEFRLVYQARRDMLSGRVTGMEALLRWQHPDLGVVEPSRFMSIAEESGLIVSIGRWVLKTACLQNIAWQRRGLAPFSIAVNLSARQFYDENLIPDVSAILKFTGMDPSLLELEFTEALLIRKAEQTLRILIGLKALKIRIAIDDFGTGYSSLATLQRFPLDTVKIDRNLVRDIIGSEGDFVLAKAIIAMGKSLSATVVAQGVETRDQAEFLRTHACDELQGFYFERPLSAEESTQLLLAQAPEITYRGERLGLGGG